MAMLIGIGVVTRRMFRGTTADYFVASRGIGSFLLLMSLFGTTMTSFAIIGSSGEAFKSGIGVYGLMVSWSGIFHSFCFFFIGIKLWSFGARYGYQTQIQFFRDRFESDKLGIFLFPALVGLVTPYILMGIIGGATAMEKITAGAFPVQFAASAGGVPFWLCGLVMCVVVLIYIFFGGVRGAAWANAVQTILFIGLGIVTFFVIADKLGGMEEATQRVVENNPSYLKLDATDQDKQIHAERLAEFKAGNSKAPPRAVDHIPSLKFLTYIFIPFSVAMFPHLFQHWLTAKSAKAFKLSVILHPLLMMLTWLPCVLIGVWATSAVMPDGTLVVPPGVPENGVLPLMVRKLSTPVMGGLLTAGVLAAIMSSLDSQFLCLGSIFTNDIVGHYIGHEKLSDRQKLLIGRSFIVVIVAICYVVSLYWRSASVFALGTWCFTGFAALAPLVFAALYWKRATKVGAYACIITAAAVGLYFFSKSDLKSKGEFLVAGMMPVTFVIAASTAALVIVSLATTPPSEKTVKKFFARAA
ncbi:MAG: sodium:solute symporter family protein [Planctomycetes bacterium]|nr:sodium:solute symporter family protein [Planctomycetota bacterium]